MPRFLFTLLLVLCVYALTASTAIAYEDPAGDLNADGGVTMADVQVLAQQWLDAGCSGPDCPADIDNQNGVNAVDFAILAANWGIQPQSVLITEFLASNASSAPVEAGELLDADGDSSDWIELFNPTSRAVDLSGWCLSNNAGNPAQWRFPAGVVLDPGAFLIVFASGKNRTVAGEELHTDFQLDADGEYLSLAKPNGTIVQEFAPQYPQQLSDISYGLAQYATKFVPPNAQVRYHVPTAADPDADWTLPGFDDSRWLLGTTGLGFGNMTQGFDVIRYKASTAVNDIETAESVVSNSSLQSGIATERAMVINYFNTGANGHFTGDNPFPEMPIGEDFEDFVVVANGMVLIPLAGEWTFGVNSDDGFALRISNSTNTFTMSYPQPRGPGDTLATFNFPEWGFYRLRLIYFERGGGSELELFAAEGGHAAFSPGAFHLVGDIAGGGLYVVSASSDVGTDVQQQMQGKNSSLWARVRFEAEEPDFFTSMQLAMQYEDGFIAYLNGVEVARRNFSGVPAWDSAADSDRQDELAGDPAKFDLSNHLDAVRDGRNVLAIHGLNDNKSNESFMLMPELAAASNQMKMQYFTQATPGAFNSAAAASIVSDTQFSHDRGFYDSPFNLTIATETPGTTIHYTVDGTMPSETHGKQYVGPISISETTCLRAVAFKTGWISSNVDTHTYIFLDDTLTQPSNPSGFPSGWDYEMDPQIVNAHSQTLKEDLKSLPTMSLVMKVDDLFGSQGIYTNWGSQGRAWERPGSIEMFYPDGSEAFSVNCGVRIYGGVGRREQKKTFRLLFKRQYGPTKLRYPLFGEDAADEFDTIILRANFNDAYVWGGGASQYVRDEYIRRLQVDLGGRAGIGNFVHLYVNGLYWGLYNPVERPDQSFSATYFGGDKDDWDGINSGHPTGESQTDAWNMLMQMSDSDLASNSAYERLQGNNPDGTDNPFYEDYLDVEQYITFLLANFYGGNNDWGSHNWYAGRLRGPESTGWKAYTWDAEWVMGMRSGLNDNSVNDTTTNNWLNKPYTYLRNYNEEFRQLFGDKVQKAIVEPDGPLYVDPLNPDWDPAHPERNRAAARYAELADAVERAMICESARWGDVKGGSPYNINQWRSQRDWVLHTYTPRRSAILFEQLRKADLYPSIDAPQYHVNGTYQHGGEAQTGDQLTIVNPNASGTIYYSLDGNDVRVPVEIEVEGMTLVEEEAVKRVLVPSMDIGSDWRSDVGYDDTTWAGGGVTGGVGYDNNSGYESYIVIDTGAQMSGGNTSCYIRIPFDVAGEDIKGLNSMTLQIRYDDGFVAYLNGTEIGRRNFYSQPAWNSSASESHGDGAAVNLESVDASDFVSELRAGANLLAIHGLNISSSSSDFLISAKLIAGETTATGELTSSSAIAYEGPIPLSKSLHMKSRVLVGTQWSALSEARFAVGPVAENLRIAEIMYHPHDANEPERPGDPNLEYIELVNIGSETLNLDKVCFADGIEFTFGNVELPGGERILVVEDTAAFATRYGDDLNVAGQFEGRLSNAGERIQLEDAAGRLIQDVRYRDGWYDITDGGGYSLTAIDPAMSDADGWSKKDAWRTSVYPGGSPGFDDSGVLPNPGAIVVNEVLAHSHDEAADWVELYNTTSNSIDIGGWYLSDSGSNRTKYRIADGTLLAAGQYLVLHEGANFGADSADPGANDPFALSENGETVYLTSAVGGTLTGYREAEDFGASETGVSFGRYYKTSTGNFNFVAMSAPTPWLANAYPKVGPIVISEIMYHPDWPALGTYTNDQYEYIELKNIGAAATTLYRYEKNAPWKFTDGIDFTFPDVPGEVTIPAGGSIVIARNPEGFLWRHGDVPAERVFGPYSGNLQNDGERIELALPGDVDKYGVQHYIRVDRVAYSDGSHPEDCPGGVDLWPAAADGYGMSLHRVDDRRYGNDPNNWQAATPSPGL